MLTEDEAKTKWCPLARTTEFDGVNGSRVRNRVVRTDLDPVRVNEPLGCHCIASVCMAWRFVEGATEEKPGHGFVRAAIGYCGAFGKPWGFA